MMKRLTNVQRSPIMVNILTEEKVSTGRTIEIPANFGYIDVDETVASSPEVVRYATKGLVVVSDAAEPEPVSEKPVSAAGNESYRPRGKARNPAPIE